MFGLNRVTRFEVSPYTSYESRPEPEVGLHPKPALAAERKLYTNQTNRRKDMKNAHSPSG